MQKKYIPGVTRDRRKQKGDDRWGATLRWLGVASWVMMFSYLAFTEKLTGAEAASANSSLSTYIFLLMILGLMVSVCGFLIIQKRNRRYSDEHTYSVLVLGLVSLCGIIYYLFMI